MQLGVLVATSTVQSLGSGVLFEFLLYVRTLRVWRFGCRFFGYRASGLGFKRSSVVA